MTHKAKPLLNVLSGIFLSLFLYFLVPLENSTKRNLFLIVFSLGFLFFITGLLLAALSLKEKKPLKKYLFLTGISSSSVFLSAVLHNVFYWVGNSTSHLSLLFNFLEQSSLIISLIIAPTIFLLAVIKSYSILRRGKIK